MKAKIKNNSRALQGVHCVDGLLFIEPGATATLDVADGYVERVKALPFLDAKWDGEEADEPKRIVVTDKVEPSDRDDLKKQAAELGLDYARNISTEKLKDLIDAKLAE